MSHASMSLASISRASAGTQIAAARSGAAATSTVKDATKDQADAGSSSSAVTEFRNFLNLSPVERMRASLLSRMGLKETDLANLSQSERQQVEDQIKAQIKEAFGGKTGQIADIRA